MIVKCYGQYTIKHYIKASFIHSLPPLKLFSSPKLKILSSRQLSLDLTHLYGKKQIGHCAKRLFLCPTNKYMMTEFSVLGELCFIAVL